MKPNDLPSCGPSKWAQTYDSSTDFDRPTNCGRLIDYANLRERPRPSAHHPGWKLLHLLGFHLVCHLRRHLVPLVRTVRLQAPTPEP